MSNGPLPVALVMTSLSLKMIVRVIYLSFASYNKTHWFALVPSALYLEIFFAVTIIEPCPSLFSTLLERFYAAT